MRNLLPLCILLFHSVLSSQNIEKNETILTAFEAYSELPREVVFVHLNKSVYIKGENIGFKAYVLDKDTKKRSLETKNLYCTIVDEKENVAKKTTHTDRKWHWEWDVRTRQPFYHRQL